MPVFSKLLIHYYSFVGFRHWHFIFAGWSLSCLSCILPAKQSTLTFQSSKLIPALHSPSETMNLKTTAVLLTILSVVTVNSEGMIIYFKKFKNLCFVYYQYVLTCSDIMDSAYGQHCIINALLCLFIDVDIIVIENTKMHALHLMA